MKSIEALVSFDFDELNDKVKSHTQGIVDVNLRFDQLKTLIDQMAIDIKKLSTSNNDEQISALLVRVKSVEDSLKRIIGE